MPGIKRESPDTCVGHKMLKKQKVLKTDVPVVSVKKEYEEEIFDNEIQIKVEDTWEEFDIKVEKFGIPNTHQDHTIPFKQSKSLENLNYVLGQLKLPVNGSLPIYNLKRKPKIKFKPLQNTIFNLNDLNLNNVAEFDSNLSFLHYVLSYSKKMVFITGAGVSVNSGIPDFRSSDGLFNNLKSKSNGSGKNLFDYNIFRDDESISSFEEMIKKLFKLSNLSKPSPFHLMMNNISENSRLLRLYTQNIDCLDIQLSNLKTQTPLKNPTKLNEIPKTIQLHGNINLINCSKCNFISDLNMEYLQKNSKLIKSCPACLEMNEVRAIAGKRLQNVGLLRPRIVLYNEFHPDGETIGSITEKDLKNKPDCLIITGTTLKIPGVRRLVKELSRVVHSNKGYVIWMNIDQPTQSILNYVDYFDMIIVGDCQLVPGLVTLYDHFYVKNKPIRSKGNTTSVKEESSKSGRKNT